MEKPFRHFPEGTAVECTESTGKNGPALPDLSWRLVRKTVKVVLPKDIDFHLYDYFCNINRGTY